MEHVYTATVTLSDVRSASAEKVVSTIVNATAVTQPLMPPTDGTVTSILGFMDIPFILYPHITRSFI